MALGDGIRRNIASVDPAERAMLRDALIELNKRKFAGSRTDTPAPGGVSWWFKQDEIHQATHVHGGPEFLPWHRVIVNEMEKMLRQINPLLSLHYWDWTQDPRAIPNANLGNGSTGTLNLFTSDFMGYGGSTYAPVGKPWREAGFYDPDAVHFRDDSVDAQNNNPADPPRALNRRIFGSHASARRDADVLAAPNYPNMCEMLERTHDEMHGFVSMGGFHISFRDPFVFLLHSNVDRLFAGWQTDPAHRERLEPGKVYGSETAGFADQHVEPWSTGRSVDTLHQEHFTRPWYAPEREGVPFTYKHPSVVYPPSYDTNRGSTAPRGTCTIQQKYNRRFLDAYTSGDKNYAVVTRTVQDDDSQRWVLTPIGTVYTVRQKSGNRFLDAHESSANNFAAFTRNKEFNDTQCWVFWRTPDDADAVTIQQVSSGRFLDAYESTHDFAAVTRPEQADNSQRWTLRAHAGGSYSLQQKSTGRFLDAQTAGDFAAVTRPAQNNDTQRWVLDQVGVVYTIQHQHNDRFLDAYTTAEQDFALVTRSRQANDSQRWLVRPLSNDTFTIQQLNSGRFVDAYTSSSHDFAAVTRDVLLWTDDTQRWVIRTVPPR
ncbi:RICIN domain-containing protein [Nocardia anaemiae]|uniref:RICIN domain-containing protein n=1 Tax=Nocardia anaemiae TaxID=263910 RepID=UPI0012F48A3D|nr:RICIN domain-containing protein [Nocardia anaemiae]